MADAQEVVSEGPGAARTTTGRTSRRRTVAAESPSTPTMTEVVNGADASGADMPAAGPVDTAGAVDGASARSTTVKATRAKGTAVNSTSTAKSSTARSSTA